MRKFVINVNGKSYEVEVEEVGAATPPATAYSAPMPQVSLPKETATPVSATVPVGASAIKAPMPGTIVSVKVKAGDMVKTGDVVCILEAMKMENEIMAPSDGKVVSVNVNQGDSVNTGDALVSLG